MEKTNLSGTFPAYKKDGTLYFRSTITHKGKHISLGSYATEAMANKAYLEAKSLLDECSAISIDDHSSSSTLLFEKWVCLINYRDNGLYIKNPIYLKQKFFLYYFARNEYFLFDVDDLFYYSEHKIMKRNGHLFVADYGMQISILSRYGIKTYARPGVDFEYINGNPYDLRRSNIKIITTYTGVTRIEKNNSIQYVAKLHIRSNYVIGYYNSEEEAAIAYNKAVDIVKGHGCQKNFQTNYIETLLPSQYADIYSDCKISKRIYELTFS